MVWRKRKIWWKVFLTKFKIPWQSSLRWDYSSPGSYSFIIQSTAGFKMKFLWWSFSQVKVFVMCRYDWRKKKIFCLFSSYSISITLSDFLEFHFLLFARMNCTIEPMKVMIDFKKWDSYEFFCKCLSEQVCELLLLNILMILIISILYSWFRLIVRDGYSIGQQLFTSKTSSHQRETSQNYFSWTECLTTSSRTMWCCFERG